jgi:RHS repeat-associated protein
VLKGPAQHLPDLNPRIDVGGHFDKEIKGAVTQYEHYIYGASGVVAIYTTSSAAPPSTHYLHQDHLGSIVAVTEETGGVIARYGFDVWGQRIPLAGDATATHHGFTGHEQLDTVGLIHMNGRVYDPLLARFLSADPYVQSPDNLQSYTGMRICGITLLLAPIRGHASTQGVRARIVAPCEAEYSPLHGETSSN